MKKTVLIIIILLLGVGVIAYPFVSNYLNEINGSHVIDDYISAVEEKDDKYIETEFKRAKEYNESLLGQPVRDPFIKGSGIVMQSDYYEILNIGGTMGYIEIPKISVKLAIYHGTAEDILKKGAGHLEGSTLPIGGVGTHTIITGHTGLPNAKLFTDLTALELGDLFYIYVLDRILAYEVEDISIILPEQTTELRPEAGKDYFTLLTCTPYGVNSHRLLVRGIRTEYIPELKESLSKTRSDADRMVIIAAVVTSVVMLILIIIVVIIKISKNRKEEIRAKDASQK